MQRTAHFEAVEKILTAITLDMGDDGLRASFIFTRPGQHPFLGGAGVEIYYHDREFIRAVLFVRKHGPLYLRYLPIDEIWRMLQEFVNENFWMLAGEVLFRKSTGNFAENVSVQTKRDLAEALLTSPVFSPPRELTLFPLVAVNVTANFDSPNFFLIAPDALDETRLPQGVPAAAITRTQFPPLTDWDGRRQIPSAWLGVRSPAPSVAERQRAAILGALALTPLPRYRYHFSGRSAFGGRATISDRISFQFGETHIPPMMYDIVVTEADHGWLGLLSEKLGKFEKAIRRELRALEYFYRAWPQDPSERFPILCMALDGIFGEAGRAAQAVIDGIRGVFGSHVPNDRLRKLMDLRAVVVHGSAPVVYDSSHFAEYYEKYGVDPIRDMELIVWRCLRDRIFDGKLKEHADPLAEKCNEMPASGRMPKRIERPSILDGSQ